jgi:hypothetical protein
LACRGACHITRHTDLDGGSRFLRQRNCHLDDRPGRIVLARDVNR